MWSSADIGKNAIASVLNDPTSSSASLGSTGSSSSALVGSAAQILHKLTPAIYSSAAGKSQLTVRQKEYAKHLAHYSQISEILGDSLEFDCKSAIVQAETAITPTTPGSIASESSPIASPTTSLSQSPILASPSSISQNTIPALFFDADFSLENPQTFSQLMALDSSAAVNTGTNSILLQEKLSHYIDLAEVQLVAEISRRSPHFFMALSNITSLKNRTQECIANLKKMRALIAELDNKQAIHGLSIIRTKQRLSRLNYLYSQIKVIKHYKSCQSYIQILLNQADYVGALDLIAEVTKGSDLNGIRVLVHLKSQLEEMTKLISSLSTSDLISLTAEFCIDFSKLKKVESAPSKESDRVLLSFVVETADVNTFQSKITNLVTSLIKTKHLSAGIHDLKENLLRNVKSVSKAHFPQHDDLASKAESVDGALARRVRTMNFDEYLLMLYHVFDSMVKILTKIVAIHSVYSSIITDQRLSAKSSEKELLLDMISSSFDLAHTRCAKLITLKAEQINLLGLKEFLRLYDLTKQFLAISENMEKQCSLSGIFTLKGVLHNHCKNWFSLYHMERLKEIYMVIDAEKWESIGAAVEFQKIVDDICVQSNLTQAVDETASSSIDDDNLLVNGRKFKIITSCILLAKILREYLSAFNINVIHPDIVNRLVELFRSYNTRVCELIVGGGAIQGNGLKNITAKHLALSSQSLLFIIEIIASIRAKALERVEERFKFLLAEFDKVVADYSVNREKIHSRIVNIMEERIKYHLDNLENLDWEKDVEGDEKAPHDYITNLAKETGKLYRILKRNVFPDTMKLIFADIFKMYNEQFAKKLTQVNIFSVNSKQKLLNDVQFYLAELAKFEGVDAPSNDIEVAANNVRIKDKSEVRPTTPAPPTPSQQPTSPPPPLSSTTSSKISEVNNVNRAPISATASGATTAAAAPKPPVPPLQNQNSSSAFSAKFANFGTLFSRQLSGAAAGMTSNSSSTNNYTPSSASQFLNPLFNSQTQQQSQQQKQSSTTNNSPSPLKQQQSIPSVVGDKTLPNTPAGQK